MFDLKKFRIDRGLSQEDIANIVGVKYRVVSNVENGRDKLPSRWIDEIKKHFNITDDQYETSEPSYKKEKSNRVALYSGSIEAGFNSRFEDGPDYIEGYINIPGIGQNEGSWIVTGKSMERTIPSGSRVILRRLTSLELIIPNHVYVIDIIEIGPILKRIRRGSAPNRLKLISDNEDYEEMEIDIRNIISVHMVLMFFSRPD